MKSEVTDWVRMISILRTLATRAMWLRRLACLFKRRKTNRPLLRARMLVVKNAKVTGPNKAQIYPSTFASTSHSRGTRMGGFHSLAPNVMVIPEQPIAAWIAEIAFILARRQA